MIYIQNKISSLCYVFNNSYQPTITETYSNTIKLTVGSNETILTVLSERPTAKNLHLCSPVGTRPRAIHTTSEDISFLSVYSFSCPVYNNKKITFIYYLDISQPNT